MDTSKSMFANEILKGLTQVIFTSYFIFIVHWTNEHFIFWIQAYNLHGLKLVGSCNSFASGPYDIKCYGLMVHMN